MEHKTKPQAKHMGRKIGRMREMLGIKQDVVADKLGVSQQTVSKIEQSENVDDSMLGKIADVLGISPEAIKNFNEEATINFIQNNYEGAATTNHGPVNGQNYNCTFSPIDKWAEAIEENKKLYEELLKSEREKVAMLQKLLEERK
ncbi:MAG: helix-turn-helix transcriptional regulator [Cytophagales bacterium]|nr:helix-turn-helix transcriptional regulator [Cytophagales bacterium]